MSYTHPVAPQSDLLGLGETFAVESPAGCDGGCGGHAEGGCGGGCGGQAEGGCGGGCAAAKPDVDMQPDVDDQADRVLRLHIEDSLFAAWTSNQFLASSDWHPAAPVKRVRARWELRDLVGPFRVAPGFQVANRETAPGAFNNIGTQQTTDGTRQTEWEDLSSYVDDKVLIRFGWVTRNSTGTALSFGHVHGVFEVELFCGAVLQFEVPFGERFPPGELIEADGVLWPSVGDVVTEAAGTPLDNAATELGYLNPAMEEAFVVLQDEIRSLSPWQPDYRESAKLLSQRIQEIWSQQTTNQPHRTPLIGLLLSTATQFMLSEMSEPVTLGVVVSGNRGGCPSCRDPYWCGKTMIMSDMAIAWYRNGGITRDIVVFLQAEANVKFCEHPKCNIQPGAGPCLYECTEIYWGFVHNGLRYYYTYLVRYHCCCSPLPKGGVITIDPIPPDDIDWDDIDEVE